MYDADVGKSDDELGIAMMGLGEMVGSKGAPKLFTLPLRGEADAGLAAVRTSDVKGTISEQVRGSPLKLAGPVTVDQVCYGAGREVVIALLIYRYGTGTVRIGGNRCA